MRRRCWSSRRAPSKCMDRHEVPHAVPNGLGFAGVRCRTVVWHGTDGKHARIAEAVVTSVGAAQWPLPSVGPWHCIAPLQLLQLTAQSRGCGIRGMRDAATP